MIEKNREKERKNDNVHQHQRGENECNKKSCNNKTNALEIESLVVIADESGRSLDAGVCCETGE